MTAIFTGQTDNFDGSGSPDSGAADVKINYTCSPGNGGSLDLYARNSGAAGPYTRVDSFIKPGVVLFKALAVDYYFVWTSRNSNAIANLDVL